MQLPFSFNRRRRLSSRPRRMGSNAVTTRSGRVLRVNSSMGGRWSEYRQAKARRKVDRMRGLPKSRVKRLFWKLNPRRMAEYWFSRDGAIMALKIVGIGLFVFFVLVIGVFAYFRKDLDAIKNLSDAKLGGSLTFYDRTGQTLLGQDYDKVKRVPVKSDQISPWIKQATVAVEDRDFYNHRGFDVKGIARAAINDIVHHGNVQGGSTITQQLVKLTEDWGDQRTIGTKFKELILAVELERSFTKDDILTAYLNMAPYGSLDYGVQVAAQDYFHKDAKDLNLAEAAMLASIPKSPCKYSPYNTACFDKKAFQDRYNYVLDSLRDTGKISKALANKTKKIDMLTRYHKQRSKFAGVLSPYFMQAAENEVVTRWSSKGPNGTRQTGAWKVITTLDTKIQKLAEQKIKDNLPNLYAHGADESATVVEDVQTGQYLALVGGVNFNAKGYGQINFAQWPISPGSSFKPYDYSTLIDNHDNAGAGSVIYDITAKLPTLGYPCTNRALPPSGNCLWDFDRRSPGPMTIRYALGGSRNIPAVKTMGMAVQGKSVQEGVDKTVQTAERLMNNGAAYACYKDGANVTLENKNDQTKCFTASAIGDGAYLHLDNHLNGLSSLGRMGLSIPATYILEIQDASGKAFYKWKQPKKGDVGVDQVVRPETAYILNNILSDPNASYFAYGTKFQHYNGWNIGVKTGTTNNSYDGLMMAYTTKYAVGSWIGYHTRTKAVFGPMENITMPITRNIIEGALDMSKAHPVNWTAPSGIKHLPAFRSRYAYSSQTGAPTTDIYPSWYKAPGTNTKVQTIDKVSSKLATKCTPPLAKQTLGGSAAPNQYSIDIFYGPGATAARGTTNIKDSDDVHSCSDDPPTITLTISGNPGKYTVSAAVTAGTHPLTDAQYPEYPGTITLQVGGTVIKTCSSVPPDVATCSTVYRPSTSAKQTVTARVTDSVLYDATDSASYHFESKTSSLKFTEAKIDGGNIKFSWTGGDPTYNVTSSSGSDIYCGNVSDNNCTYHSPLAPGTTVKVTDSNGQTDTTTVST